VVSQFETWGFMDSNSNDGSPHFHSSERFPGILSGLGQGGGAVTTAYDLFRKNGIVPFTILPVSPTMTMTEYFDPTAITSAIKQIGLDFLSLMGGKNFLQYTWIVDGGATNVPKMAQYQPAGPYSLGIPVDDTGWNQVHPTIATGTAVHVVSGYAVTGGSVNISDNYQPNLKILDPGYQISYVLQVIVQYIPPPPAPTLPPNPTPIQTQTWLQSVVNWLQSIVNTLSGVKGRNLGSTQMSYNLFKSRTFYTSVLLFVFNGFSAISGSVPSQYSVPINFILGALIAYFHVSGVQAAATSSATLGTPASGQ